MLKEWYMANKEWISWVFSGIGVVAIGWVIALFSKRSKAKEEAPSGYKTDIKDCKDSTFAIGSNPKVEVHNHNYPEAPSPKKS